MKYGTLMMGRSSVCMVLGGLLPVLVMGSVFSMCQQNGRMNQQTAKLQRQT